MPSFRRVVIAVSSIVFCSAFAFGQARLGPYVVDSNGVKVGHAIDTTDVLIFIEGEPVKVGALRSGFAGASFNLLFTDGACGGQPLLEAGSDVLFGLGFYTTDGVIHYFVPGSTSEMLILSQLLVQPDGTLGACSATSFPLVVAPELTAPPPAVTPPLTVVDVLPVSPAPGTATFNDVPTSHPFFRFIEALSASGITAGCSAAPPLYCPNDPVTRGQMAVFIAKAVGL
jgi:hypothetical protein